MYESIRSHPTAREVWAKELERQGIVTRDEAQAMTAEVMQKLSEARTQPTGKGLAKGLPTPENLAEFAKQFRTR